MSDDRKSDATPVEFKFGKLTFGLNMSADIFPEFRRFDFSYLQGMTLENVIRFMLENDGPTLLQEGDTWVVFHRHGLSATAVERVVFSGPGAIAHAMTHLGASILRIETERHFASPPCPLCGEPLGDHSNDITCLTPGEVAAGLTPADVANDLKEKP